jgi:hypothetical protein
MTKALRPKRPALIPMLDSVVQKYLQDDHLGAQARFGERAPGLARGYGLTEVRILGLLIVSVTAAARPAGA